MQGGLYFSTVRGFAALGVNRKVRAPLLVGLSIAYLTAYVLLMT